MSKIAERYAMVDNPNRICLIPKENDEDDDKVIAIIVAVNQVTPEHLVLGVTGDDAVARAIRTTFDWKTGLVVGDGKLGKLKVPPSELARIEEFDTQGAYSGGG